MTYPRLFALLLCASLIGGLLSWQLTSRMSAAGPAAPPAIPAAAQNVPQGAPGGPGPMDPAALTAEVTRLRGVAPSASVAMADVGFHWSNLWFAGQAGNWPLANYYFSEARNHIRWLIRINPMPKGPTGDLVDLQGIFDGIDTGVFKDVKDTIDKQDGARFPVVYRQALEACYSCHKSVGRPYTASDPGHRAAADRKPQSERGLAEIMRPRARFQPLQRIGCQILRRTLHAAPPSPPGMVKRSTRTAVTLYSGVPTTASRCRLVSALRKSCGV